MATALEPGDPGVPDSLYLQKARQFINKRTLATEGDYVIRAALIDNKEVSFGVTDARAAMLSMKRWFAKETMEQRYIPLKETVGKGSFGKVCAYTDLNRRKDGLVRSEVAIKKVHAKDEIVGREIGINIYLGNHQNIVPIEYVYESKIRYYLVMPRYFSDMFHHCNNSQVSDITRKSWIKDICTGLDYMHKKGVIHGDMKPKNVLLSYETNCYNVSIAAISDFNLSFCAKDCTSAYLDPELTYNNGFTPDYVSPEVFKQQWINLHNRKLQRDHVKAGFKGILKVYLPEPYGCDVDMWGVGMILRELYTFHRIFLWLPCPSHQRLFRGGYNHTCADCVFQHFMSLCTGMSSTDNENDMNHLIKDQDAQDVIKQLLVVPPRPSAAEILMSPFIKSLDKVQKTPTGVLDTSLCVVPYKVQPPRVKWQAPQPPKVPLRDIKTTRPSRKTKRAPSPPTGVAPLLPPKGNQTDQHLGFGDLKTTVIEEKDGAEQTPEPLGKPMPMKVPQLPAYTPKPTVYYNTQNAPILDEEFPDEVEPRQKDANPSKAPENVEQISGAEQTFEPSVKPMPMKVPPPPPYTPKPTGYYVTQNDPIPDEEFPDEVEPRQKDANPSKAPENVDDTLNRERGGNAAEREDDSYYSEDDYSEDESFDYRQKMMELYISKHRPHVNMSNHRESVMYYPYETRQ